MRLLKFSAAALLLVALFFSNINHTHATSGTIVTNPTDTSLLVNKTYQLPQDYVPENLVTPNVDFSGDSEQLRSVAAHALENMFTQANQDQIELRAASGYRSYDYQLDLYQGYVDEHGEDYANQISAKAGHSEHQTGLAIDVTSPAADYRLTKEFGDTEAGEWVREHASEFGFIIRYPKGKEDITGYTYEPWHLRYVGKDIAQYIMNNSLTLEEYHGENNPNSSTTYTVKPGDTLWEISQNYQGLSVQNLLDLNPSIDPYQLQVGMELTISNDASNNDSNEDNTSEGNETYVVKPGDSVWEIAQQYNDLTMNEIMQANPGIEPRSLTINQTITIPTSEGNESSQDQPANREIYTVQPGDTLWQIAKNYHDVNLEEIKQANPSVNPRLLSIGSEIKIP